MTRMNTSKITDEWQEALINQPDFLKQAMQIFCKRLWPLASI
jgi:hypothetical protein